MRKVTKDGLVAVLYSPNYGSGWASNEKDHKVQAELCMGAEIVEAFMAEGPQGAVKAATNKFPNFYTGGARDLRLIWIDQGRKFQITEYDGYEGIEYADEMKWLKA